MKDTVILNSQEQATGVYLTKNRKNSIVHFWLDNDTVCRQWSKGSWRKEEYSIVTNTLGRNICTQCANVAIKLRLDV